MPKNKKNRKTKTKNTNNRKGNLFGRLGSLAGGLAGSYFGASSLGSKLGKDAGDYFSKITGLGDYVVNANTLMSNGVPVFKNGGDATTIICKSEYICDVLGSQNFVINTGPINPGNPTLFPWLSTVADSYEAYEFRGLILQYRPTCGSAVSSSNNAMGTVILSTEYDVLNPPFNSKRAMEAHQYTVSTAPFNSIIHPVECKPNLNVMKNMYVRNAFMPASADLRFYDLGNFSLATVGMQSNNVNIGELWISYEVVLYKPQLPNGSYAHLTCASNCIYSNEISNNPAQTTLPFTQSGTTCSVSLPQAGNYSFNMDVVYSSSGAATTNLLSTFVVPGTNSYLNQSVRSAEGYQDVGFYATIGTNGSVSSVGTNSCMSEFCTIGVNGGGDIVTVSVPSSTSSVSGSDLYVTSLGLGGVSFVVGNSTSTSIAKSDMAKESCEDFVEIKLSKDDFKKKILKN